MDIIKIIQNNPDKDLSTIIDLTRKHVINVLNELMKGNKIVRVHDNVFRINSMGV